MTRVDLRRIEKRFELVDEASEKVAEFEFHINEFGVLKVKVLRLSGGAFLGVADHRCNYNYLSLHQRDTIREAVEEALNGFLAFWKPSSPKNSTPINENY